MIRQQIGLIGSTLALACLLAPFALADTPVEEGFVSLFDGKTMEGWKVSEENPGSWQVSDGMLKCDGPRAHLFYVGDLAPFDDFHFKAEVMTTANSNSGIYFHTKYQAEDWPKYGYECQVNVSYEKDKRKSSSLYAVDDVADPGLEDDKWYTQEIIVRGRNIVLKINGKTMVDHTEPEDKPAFSDRFERRLGEGTFALQAHDPHSVAYFRNLRVKKLDE